MRIGGVDDWMPRVRHEDDRLIAAAVRLVLGALAVGCAMAAFMAGAFALGVRLQPDTGHGEDIARPFGFVASFAVLVPAACVGLASASAYTVLGTRWRHAVVFATLILVAAGTLTFIYAVQPL